MNHFVRSLGLLATLLLISAFTSSGCSMALAPRIVQAPNRSYPPEAKGDAPREVLEAHHVSRQLRIPVGPPDATLSVWVFEPFRGGTRIKSVRTAMRTEAVITRKPSTKPSPGPVVPRGTIVLLHGIEDYKQMYPYTVYREILVAEGYRCIMVDLRGHGRSTGDWISYGVYESRDLVQVLDYLDREGLIAGQVGAIGASYGASVAIQWAAIDPRVKAVVALEPYADLQTAARDAADFVLGKYRWLFSDADIHATVRRAARIAGFDARDASPVQAIRKCSAPVLLVHSRADELIPFSHSQRLHDAAPWNSKLIAVSGQSHFNMWSKSLKLIGPESMRWFERHLAPPQNGREDPVLSVEVPRN